ncbi:hypothetical protein JTE90_023329 [Oedothorax gibbosus]|uniref:Fucosyltransferase n=1 Tax=Oedothorax gibbosus TaxID=931172 RepID=A0AAV6VGR8_9ARAC|nr:hypothetical protein JTE90_023329 [Oedothorax gibbosus]
MQSKKVKRIFLLILLLGLLYNLFVTSTHQWRAHLRKNTIQNTPTTEVVNTSTVSATHGALPPHFKGKKLAFDPVYEPRQIGFLPKLKRRHQQQISTVEAVNTSEVFATHAILPPHFKGKKLTFDRVYEPRQVGFLPELKPVPTNYPTKTILLWTKWNSLRKTINYYFLQPGNRSFVKHNCPNPHCRTTFNRKYIHRVDAVLFHLIDTKTEDIPSFRSPRQVWILYNMEPPWQVQKHKSSELNSLNNLFNWTMGYGGNSDIVARYGFVGKSNAVVSSGELDNVFTEKTKDVVWFVSDCSTDSRREDYVEELRKFIDIDIFGKCGHCKCYPSQSSSCYEGVLQSYKFYLSFENAICKDYVTEKFFNVFNYNIVPVVFGGANYSNLAPKGSFVDATKYPQPKLLAEVLIEIANNETIYTEYLTKKFSFRAYLDPWMCKLCNKLHSYKENSTLKDVSKWLDQDSQCNKWNISSQTFIYKTI